MKAGEDVETAGGDRQEFRQIKKERNKVKRLLILVAVLALLAIPAVPAVAQGPTDEDTTTVDAIVPDPSIDIVAPADFGMGTLEPGNNLAGPGVGSSVTVVNADAWTVDAVAADTGDTTGFMLNEDDESLTNPFEISSGIGALAGTYVEAATGFTYEDPTSLPLYCRQVNELVEPAGTFSIVIVFSAALTS